MSLPYDFHIAHKARVGRMWCASKISVTPIPQRSYIAPTLLPPRARRAPPAADLSMSGKTGAFRMEHGVTQPRRFPSARTILSIVAAQSGLSVHEIIGPSRFIRVIKPRQLALYFMRQCTLLSTVAIGRIVNRDHSTVVHSVNRVKADISAYEPLFSAVAAEIGPVQEVPFE